MSDDDNNQKNSEAGKSPASTKSAPRRSGFGRGGDSQVMRERPASPAPAPYAPPTDAVREAPEPRRPRAARPFGERASSARDDAGEPAQRRSSPAPRRPREDGEAPRRDRPDADRPVRRSRDGDDRPKRAFTSGRTGYGSPADGKRPRRPDDRERPPRFERAAPQRGERPDRYAPADREAAPRVIRAEEPERIAKVMARAGVASRRDSEAMILAGRVTVNGSVIDSPALDVTSKDRITVDGEMLPDRERTRLWLYHKPRGLVTTARDTEGRPTVFEALPEDLPRVITVGRLDINTEGLLLLTNDGGLARVLELPRTGWLRRYRVRAFGEVDQAQLDSLRDGIDIDGEHYGPITARFEREQGANTWLTVDLREGKNREVKRVLEHVGLIVNRLIRVSFGPFQLADLPEGEVEEVRMRVIKDQLGPELAAEAGVDFDAARRDEAPAQGQSAPRARSEGEAPKRGRRDDKAPLRPERGPKEERAEARDKPWTKVVWRDPEVDALIPRGGGGPRRGADPKAERAERAAAGTAVRQRQAAVADPKGRRIRVERVTSSAAAASRPAEGPPGRKLGRARRDDFFDETGARKPRPPVEAAAPGERRPPGSVAGRSGPPRREDGERPRGFKGRDAKSRDFKSRDLGSRSDRETAERQVGARSFGEKPRGAFGKGPGGKGPGGKGPGGKGPGGKGPGGKGFGKRPGGGRSDGPGKGRPGGGSRGPRA